MIEKFKITDLNPDDRKSIEQIISQYYIDPRELITNSFFDNDYIYIIRREEQIATFFMTGVKEKKGKTIIHLGLSGANKNLSKANDIKELWAHFKQEIIKEIGNSIIYSTTTSPYIFNSSFNLFPKTEPDKNFNYSDEYIEIRDELAEIFSWKTNEIYLFVLKSFSKKTIYNENERNRLKLYSQRYHVDFSKVGCHDSEGDRILLIHNS